MTQEKVRSKSIQHDRRPIDDLAEINRCVCMCICSNVSAYAVVCVCVHVQVCNNVCAYAVVCVARAGVRRKIPSMEFV